jgi:hypothetical protein
LGAFGVTANSQNPDDNFVCGTKLDAKQPTCVFKPTAKAKEVRANGGMQTLTRKTK